MGRNVHASRKDFSITGTGAAVGEFQFNPVVIAANNVGTAYVRYSGKLLRFYVRSPTGSTATAATFYFFTNSVRGVTSPSTTARDNMVALTSSVPISASATTPSLDTPFDSKPIFKDSLTLVVDVTAAAGAWTLQGYVEIAED